MTRNTTITPPSLTILSRYYYDLFSPIDGESGTITFDLTEFYYPNIGFRSTSTTTVTGPMVLSNGQAQSNGGCVWSYSRSGATITLSKSSGNNIGWDLIS